jgi:hypothetical protein
MKLSKEDIKKYGTLKEIKLLEGFEGDETDFFEIPLDDEEDQSLPDEEFSLEDKQEAETTDKISIPHSLLDDIIDYLFSHEESDERDELLDKLSKFTGEAYNTSAKEDDEGGLGGMKPWEKY